MAWFRGLCVILAIIAVVLAFGSALYIGKVTGLSGYAARQVEKWRSPDPGHHPSRHAARLVRAQPFMQE